MKFIKYVFIFLLIFTSCKATKKSMDISAIVKEMSAKKVAKKHIAASFNKNTIDARLKANFNNGKTKQSISVSMKIVKDEVIWLKGTKFITIFKAKITPTSVRYYSAFARNYFEGDFSMLEKLLGVEINFNQLQNLLLGQSLQNLKEEKQQIVIEDNSYVLWPKNQIDLFDIFFSVNSKHFKLDSQSIVNASKNQRLDIFYPSYDLADNVLFPSEINIKAKNPNKFTNIDFLIKSVVFDTDLNTSFAIPNKGYKRIIL